MKQKPQKIIVIALIGLCLAVGIFYMGTWYGKSHARPGGAWNDNFRKGNLPPVQGGKNMHGQGGFMMGEILSKDEKSMTLKLPDGGSLVILMTDKTQIMQMTSATPDVLVVGTSVSVQGEKNSDGSITATSIQLRPDNKNNDEHGDPSGQATTPVSEPIK